MSILYRLFLLFGDFIALFLALATTLFIRYGTGEFFMRLGDHLLPFLLLFFGWFFIFFIADLYTARLVSSFQILFYNLLVATGVSFGFSVLAFYLFGSFFSLAPKTNLVLFSLLALCGISLWRFAILRFAPRGRVRVLLLGDSPSFAPTLSYIKKHPHFGYHVLHHLPKPTLKELQGAFSTHSPDLVVFSSDSSPHSYFSGLSLSSRVSFMPFHDFYEMLFERVSIPDIDEAWVADCLRRQNRAYDIIKRSLDLAIAVPLFLLFLPLMFCIGVLVRLTSSGPAIFSQKRMGHGSRPFVLHKFRTMYQGSTGPLWTERRDRRVTAFGKFLRFTHLDELPQLFNIVRGDISFTGPRPERYELAEKYRSLPYYDLRHLVKPGLTGWAQINFRASASVEEAEEKLRYDLYYVRNRSFFLDAVLFLKTIRHLFFSLS